MKVESYINHALDCLCVDDIEIHVEWNNRFTSRMGDATLKYRPDGSCYGIIRLSKPLWPHATEEQRRHTVIHEVCHIIQRLWYGFTDTPHSHNWKNLMIRCGEKPNRCHDVSRAGLAKITLIKCGCMTHEIGPRQKKNMMSGKRAYRCKRCKERLVLSVES